MRCRLLPVGADLEHRADGALARGAAGAERHREKSRLELRELLAGDAQLLHALRRLRRKELEGESSACVRARMRARESRARFGRCGSVRSLLVSNDR